MAVRFILVFSPSLVSTSLLQLITILNRCHRFPGFVYQQARFSSDHQSIEIAVRPRKGSKAVCSRCHKPAPGYDQLTERRFERPSDAFVIRGIIVCDGGSRMFQPVLLSDCRSRYRGLNTPLFSRF